MNGLNANYGEFSNETNAEKMNKDPFINNA